MTFRQLSHCVAVAPVAVAALGFSLDSRSAIWDVNGLLALPVAFLVLHILGVWFYLPFAVCVALLLRRLGPLAHRRFTFLSPLAFACWVLTCLLAYALLRHSEPVTWRDSAALLRILGYVVLVGYVYVALLLVLWRSLPSRLRIREPAV